MAAKKPTKKTASKKPASKKATARKPARRGNGHKRTARNPKGAGRPTKLSPAVCAAICERIAEGHYLESAAAFAGVQSPTVRAWIKKGVRDGEGEHHAFALDYFRAEAQAEVDGLKRIREAAHNDWKADAWFLERRYPRRWGRWQRHEHTGPDGAPIEAGAPPVVVYLPDNGRGDRIVRDAEPDPRAPLDAAVKVEA